MNRNTRAGGSSKPVPDAKDHLGWIEYWFKELLWAMEDYRVTGNPLSLQHCDRSARCLHGRAIKRRPRLKP